MVGQIVELLTEGMSASSVAFLRYDPDS